MKSSLLQLNSLFISTAERHYKNRLRRIFTACFFIMDCGTETARIMKMNEEKMQKQIRNRAVPSVTLID